MQLFFNSGGIKTFLAGIFVGIVLGSIGFNGLWRVLDKGIDKVKIETYELAR